MKTCPACKMEKDLSSFGKDNKRPDKLTSACKACRKLSMSEWTTNNKAYYKQKHIEWKEKNPEAWAAHKHKDYVKHREKRLATDKKRKQETHYSARYEAARKKVDPCFRLVKVLRTRLQCALKTNAKKGSAVRDLGCSVQHLKLHLELFWDEGMSWLNYGNKEGQWSIDHIKPLSLFDLTDRSQLLQAVHYTNLQPLWHADNLKKSDTYVCG